MKIVNGGNVKDYLKDIGNGREVFDFHKINAAGFGVNFMLSERGVLGKTMSFKEFALDEYINKGIGSYFMKNTEKLIETELPKTLKNHRLTFPERWKDVTREGKHLLHEKNGKKTSFLEYLALSTSEGQKGSRDASKQYVFLDEFNVGDSHIRKNQTFLLDNFYATMTTEYGEDVKNPIKSFIAGNFKSLASALLVDLRIFTIEHEVIKIYSDDGMPLILILTPKKSKKKVEKLHRKNWVYHVSNITGNAAHMFGNENKYDTINAIKTDMDKKLHKCIHKAIYKIEGRFIDVWFNPSNPDKGIWFMSKVSDDVLKLFNKKRSETNIVAGTKKDMDGNYTQLGTEGKLVIRNFISKGQVHFDSMITKNLVISCL